MPLFDVIRPKIEFSVNPFRNILLFLFCWWDESVIEMSRRKIRLLISKQRNLSNGRSKMSERQKRKTVTRRIVWIMISVCRLYFIAAILLSHASLLCVCERHPKHHSSSKFCSDKCENARNGISRLFSLHFLPACFSFIAHVLIELKSINLVAVGVRMKNESKFQMFIVSRSDFSLLMATWNDVVDFIRIVFSEMQQKCWKMPQIRKSSIVKIPKLIKQFNLCNANSVIFNRNFCFVGWKKSEESRFCVQVERREQK